jgi:hypothetical protein
MKKRFTEEQIVRILQEAGGVDTKDGYRRDGAETNRSSNYNHGFRFALPMRRYLSIIELRRLWLVN